MLLGHLLAKYKLQSVSVNDTSYSTFPEIQPLLANSDKAGKYSDDAELLQVIAADIRKFLSEGEKCIITKGNKIDIVDINFTV